MLNLIGAYENYLSKVKQASANTISSYMRDIRQFSEWLQDVAGVDVAEAKQLNISDTQLSYVTNSGEGEGLLFYGSTIIPFKDRFNKNLKLYSLMTTKPIEVEKRKEEEAKAGNNAGGKDL